MAYLDNLLTCVVFKETPYKLKPEFCLTDNVSSFNPLGMTPLAFFIHHPIPLYSLFLICEKYDPLVPHAAMFFEAYFATIVCGRLWPLLEAWASLMSLLFLTGVVASCSGCCLNGCCNCAKTFSDTTETAGHEMTIVTARSPRIFFFMPVPFIRLSCFWYDTAQVKAV